MNRHTIDKRLVGRPERWIERKTVNIQSDEPTNIVNIGLTNKKRMN
jgi:hypothetical protein